MRSTNHARRSSSISTAFMLAIAGVVLIFFCHSLLSYDGRSTSHSNVISLDYEPLSQSQSQSLSDSLEDILRPIRGGSTDIVATQTESTTFRTRSAETVNDDTDTGDTATDMDTEGDTSNLVDIDVQFTDYWDFPVSSQVAPTSASSVRHRAEYEMHIARKEWFEKEYTDKSRSISASSTLITDFETRCPEFEANKKYVQWYPPKEALCNWSNTAIFWHSMHGTMIGTNFRGQNAGDHWMWEFADELKASGTCSCPANVAFVFADNQHKDMRLSERSYTYCNANCHFYHVAQDYHPWDWFGKIGPLLQLIDDREFQSKHEYVVLTDADDQSLVQSPMDIVARFTFYNASLVVGGEATSYPHWQLEEKGFENTVSPWSRHHQHLNAGAFMGRIVDVIPYLKYMQDDYENFTITNAEEIKERGRNYWRDQTVWRQMHKKFYPDIKIDSLAKIWTRTDLFMYAL